MNTITPALGSNQYLTKFEDKPKAKRSFKIKVKFQTKVKIALVAVLMFSLYLNYHMLKDNYVLTCESPTIDGIQQEWGHFGHFMKQSTCEQIQKMKVATLSQVQ
jgi:hypothetical protein